MWRAVGQYQSQKVGFNLTSITWQNWIAQMIKINLKSHFPYQLCNLNSTYTYNIANIARRVKAAAADFFMRSELMLCGR